MLPKPVRKQGKRPWQQLSPDPLTFPGEPPRLGPNANAPAVFIILGGPAEIVPGTFGTHSAQVWAICLNPFVDSLLLEKIQNPTTFLGVTWPWAETHPGSVQREHGCRQQLLHLPLCCQPLLSSPWALIYQLRMARHWAKSCSWCGLEQPSWQAELHPKPFLPASLWGARGHKSGKDRGENENSGGYQVAPTLTPTQRWVTYSYTKQNFSGYLLHTTDNNPTNN